MLRALVLDDQGVLSRAEPGMLAVVETVRAAGVRTGLLSNAEGGGHPYGAVMDAAVLSGEAGVRKPQRAAYLLVAQRLGVPPADCVFVDDLAVNVRGAVEAGMVGVLHRSVEATTAELSALFGLPLTPVES
ncbi:MAG TPA: HAD-IA family hydrolase [Mycobacteriales bacterium]|nr:HAD-IA family hydrolase [Mycobacteriales bacterium]